MKNFFIDTNNGISNNSYSGTVYQFYRRFKSGSNDIFYVRGRGLDRVKSLRIFSRWGQIVFEQKDFPVNSIQHGWDGKMQGQKPHPDVYVYQVEVYCDNGQLINLAGNVALIQ